MEQEKEDYNRYFISLYHINKLERKLLKIWILSCWECKMQHAFFLSGMKQRLYIKYDRYFISLYNINKLERKLLHMRKGEYFYAGSIICFLSGMKQNLVFAQDFLAFMLLNIIIYLIYADASTFFYWQYISFHGYKIHFIHL